MQKINKQITLAPFLFALLLVATGASAMTMKDDEMMKEDKKMMSTTSDAMMKEDKMIDDKKMEEMKMDDSMMKKEESTMVPSFDLSIGSSGEEVVTLQKFLVAQNLLMMPAGVQMGYFGPLTKAALMSYQSAHALPGTGYFGPLTRAAMAKGMMMKDDKMMKEDKMMSSTSDAMMKEDKMMDDKMMKKEVR